MPITLITCSDDVATGGTPATDGITGGGAGVMLSGGGTKEGGVTTGTGGGEPAVIVTGLPHAGQNRSSGFSKFPHAGHSEGVFMQFSLSGWFIQKQNDISLYQVQIV